MAGRKEANRLLEAAIQEKELKIESDGDSEGALNDEILALIRDKEQALGDLRSKTERRDYLNKEKAQKEAVAEKLREELEEMARVAEKQEKDVLGLKEGVDKKAAALESMNEAYERLREKVAVVDSGEKSRREALEQLADQRHSLESRLQALDYLLKERTERLSQLKKRREEWQGERDTLLESVEEYKEKAEGLTKASEDLEAGLKDKQKRQAEIKIQIDGWDSKIKSLSMSAEGIEREKRYLERLRDNHEGFQHGVKQFLKAAHTESFMQMS